MDKQVKIYSTPTCPYCQRAKAYLKEKNISFADIDVSVNREAADEMIKISGQMGVPVIMVGDEVTVGFDKNKIEELLASP